MFRTKTETLPNRQIFENGLEKVQSLNNATSDALEWGGGTYLWNHGSANTTLAWNGEFYAIQIYNRALSLEEIQESYAAMKARFAIP